MKAKDLNIYSIFSRTYKKKMFSFMDFGEIARLKKGKTIKQVPAFGTIDALSLSDSNGDFVFHMPIKK